MVRQARQQPLPKFSDTLTLSQPRGGADYAHPLALSHQKMFRDYAPGSAQVGLLHTCLWSDIHTDKIPAHWQLHSLFISGHVGISARHSNQFRVSVNTQAKSAVTFFLLFEELLQRKKGIYEHIINLTPRQKLKDFGIDVRGRP